MASEMKVIVRRSTSEDAIRISQLAKQFASYLQNLGDPTEYKFNAEKYLRDGFGANPTFTGLVAEVERQIVGYLLYHFGYDTDRAIRLMHMVDLIVHEEMRDKGCGTPLMQAAARIGEEVGVAELTWSVY